jgi:nitrate reductase gamma subunit
MNAKRWLPTALAACLIVGIGTLLWRAPGTAPKNDGALVCLDCHRRPNIQTNEGVATANAFCGRCHASAECQRTDGPVSVSLQVPEGAFNASGHAHVACIHCHTDVARNPHQSAGGAQCRSCHPVHGNGPLGDPHLRVACQACHMASPHVALDAQSQQVRLLPSDSQGQTVTLAEHKRADLQDPALCAKCHTTGNIAGAPAWVLPNKSALCLVCHPSPLTMGHWTLGLAGLIGLVGLGAMVAFWFRGTVAGETDSTHRKVAAGSEAVWSVIFSRRLAAVMGALVLDVVLQRRLFRIGLQRWMIHGLILWAFVGRLALALTTGAVFHLAPNSALALALIDKNHWAVALINDALGAAILIGVVWAALLRFVVKPAHVLSQEQDTISLALVGALIFSGFFLEAARIIVTQVPAATAGYAFVGFGLARVLALLPVDWQQAQGVLWVAHAACWAVFVAYLPFGKLKHVFTTPLSLVMEAALAKTVNNEG